MSISEKINRALADIELVRKSLDAVDRDNAEAEAVKRILEATQAELAETQARLETSKADLVKAVASSEGTGHGAYIAGASIAGKTGTAELKASKGTEGQENARLRW